MDFRLTPEQTGFAQSLGELMSKADSVAAARAWADGDHDPGLALWKRLAEQGVTALVAPEDEGGLGGTLVDLVVAFEVLGHHLAVGPWIESAALAPQVDGDLVTVAVAAVAPYALDADVARLLHGVAGEQVRSVDTTRRLFAVDSPATYDDAALDRATLAAAAQLLGCGERLLADSVEYVKQRKQYGRTIGSYQAIKHQLADVRIALDFARPLVLGAALTAASRDVSAAKVAAGDAAYLASRVALQVHGAIGYTAEFDLGLWINRVRALVGAWGTSSYHRGRIASALVEERAQRASRNPPKADLMHFARTEEQDELAAIVRSLLDKRSDSAAVRAAAESEAGYDEAPVAGALRAGRRRGAPRPRGVRRLRRLARRDSGGPRGARRQPGALAAARDEHRDRRRDPARRRGDRSATCSRGSPPGRPPRWCSTSWCSTPTRRSRSCPRAGGLSLVDGADLARRECLDQTIRLGPHDTQEPVDARARRSRSATSPPPSPPPSRSAPRSVVST